MIAYGYRFREVSLPSIKPLKPGTVFTKPRLHNYADQGRPPRYVTIGLNVRGNACPTPDPNDPYTTMAGGQKRFCFRPPQVDKALLKKFSSFVAAEVKKYTPLSPDVDTSVESWLARTNYPEWRKRELLEIWKNTENPWDVSWRKVKSFMKWETYPEYKHARVINSRSDVFKCLVGPIFKLIEKEVFSDAWFIKKIPVADRPRYIAERLTRVGCKYLTSDYTAFESLFTKEIMEACEMQLYAHMVSLLPGGQQWYNAVHDAMTGENRCEFKRFLVKLFATRMSGEMCTSLGNGFSNMMFIKFMCSELGSTVEGVVEGDDGLFSISGRIPTEKDFEKLGLVIKLQVHDRLETASFCGLVFDSHDLVNVTDPAEALCNFGWLNGMYAGSKDSKLMTLLRCKALSFVHQYPGCPILYPLGLHVLRLTRSYDVRHMIKEGRGFSMWEREQLLDALESLPKDELKVQKVDVPIRTRLLVEELYKIPVSMQLSIEARIKASKIEELDIPEFDLLGHRDWRDYHKKYVLPVPKDIHYPPIAMPLNNESLQPLHTPMKP